MATINWLTNTILKPQHNKVTCLWDISLFTQQLPSSACVVVTAAIPTLTHSTIIYCNNWRDKVCISDIPIIYSVVHSTCLCGSDEMFYLMDIYTYILLCLFTSVVFKKAAVLAIIFPWVIIAPFGFPERKKWGSGYVYLKKINQIHICHVITCGSGCEADKCEVFCCRRL